MNDILLVVIKILPILLVLLLGNWIRRTEFISEETIHGMTKLILKLLLPCILFLSFFNAEMKPELLILSILIFAVCIVTFSLGFLFKKFQKSDNQFYPSIFTTFLSGPVGYPLFSAYFGTEHLYKLAILDVGNTIFIFTVLVAFMSTVSCGASTTIRTNITVHLKKLLKSPQLLSIAAGIFFSLTGFSHIIVRYSAVSSLLDTIQLLANAAFPLTLLIVGYELPFDFKNVGNVLKSVFLRMAMMLAIAYLINTFILIRWLDLDKIYQAALFTLFLLPPPFIIPLTIIGECDHKKYVLDFISLHLIVSLIAFVVMLNLL